MQTNYFSPEMQLWPIKHKRKDAHSTHCTRREKNVHRHLWHALLLSHFISPPSKLQHKSKKEQWEGLEQNTGLGFLSNIKPCFPDCKMEDKNPGVKLLVKWLKILRTACESNPELLIGLWMCLYQYLPLGSCKINKKYKQKGKKNKTKTNKTKNK